MQVETRHVVNGLKTNLAKRYMPLLCMQMKARLSFACKSCNCPSFKLLALLQGALPLKANWSVQDGVELLTMPLSKPLGAVLAGHTWYHSMS